MLKLILQPVNSSYSVTEGNNVAAVQLDGGASRYRLDKIGASSGVDVMWECDREEYDYLRAFYKGVANYGATPFQIDLVLDDSQLKTYTAYIKPGTFKLVGQRGLSHTVTASLEVKPLPVDQTYFLNTVTMASNLGFDWIAKEDVFDTLINVSLPGVIN